jgi:hypothetical protein
MREEPQPWQPGQRLAVRVPDVPERQAEVIDIGEYEDAVTVEHPGAVDGSFKRDVVWVRYPDGDREIGRVRYHPATVIDN